MVQQENQPETPTTPPTPIPIKNLAKGVEEGRYRLVGWAIDTTGRRLIDEICQIAAFTPESQFSQYIMPFSDIRLIYRRRHSIRVINMGRYRMLKDLRTNKFVKTKSEISALTDFLVWLEQIKGDATEGIILLFHDIHKYTPAMLLESMRRHHLSERFAKVVKGFANCFNISQDKCVNTTKTFSLRVMSKILLNKEEDISSAVTRAQSCYEIVVHLGQSEVQDLDSKGSGDCKGSESHLIDMVRPYTNPVQAEEGEIVKFKVLLDRQNTFKPVFGALLRATATERQHASHMRRILAENNIDYDQLRTAFDNNAKDGLEKVLRENIVQSEETNVKEEEIKELLEILDCFFDPEKKAVQPKPRFYANHHNGPRKPGNKQRGFVDKENKDKNANMMSAVDEKKPEIKTEIKTELPDASQMVEAEVTVSSAVA
ncbi:maternal protein exuperantia-1 [Onthophagus taurus]|uniref:maternal protein exuperantia-1 n=1 Tax=Onthophagus taurus TaxID=166361 RepID=UPI000C209C01|nr:maternal protein exuperantia [Onthophagus taurus]XP_022913064.1 maternal protein exuperantia [Onthophagus taurus]